jgi:hypothetical protein
MRWARGDEAPNRASPSVVGRGPPGGPGRASARWPRVLRWGDDAPLDTEANHRAGAGSRTVSTPHVGVGLPINHKMLRSRKLAKRAFGTGVGRPAGGKTAIDPQLMHMSQGSGAARGMVFGRASEIAQAGASTSLRSVRHLARPALHRHACAGVRRGFWVHGAKRPGARNAVHTCPGDLSGQPDSSARFRIKAGSFTGLRSCDGSVQLAPIASFRHMEEVVR